MTRGLTKKLKETEQLKKVKKGFTLIELIVVIAIIGVLAAMLVPSMMGYVNDSKIAKNDANARTIYTAAQAAYTSINDNTLVGTVSSDGTSTFAAGSESDNKTKYIAKVKELVGDIDGKYTITLVANKGVEKVVYVVGSGTATSESSVTTGIYPTAK